MKPDIFMLDTDTSSYLIKGNTPNVTSKFLSTSVSRICISAVTRAELQFGLQQRLTAKLQDGVRQFLNTVITLAWDEQAADRFGLIRSILQKQGTPIGDMDTMIAAHARSVNAVLVTNNQKHFTFVPGLALDNWVQ